MASTVICASFVSACLVLVPDLSHDPLATAQLVFGATLAVLGVGLAQWGLTGE